MRIRLEAAEAADRFRGVLEAGGIAIVPCDTLYGLVGCVPDSAERLRLIKGRGEDKPFLILIPDVERCADFSPLPVPRELARFWPGPLTVILPGQGGATVALRVPDARFLRETMRETGRALYSTSVNRAGNPALWRMADIEAEFSRDVDLILSSGDLPGRLPSTIVDATARPLRIIRQGALELPGDLLGSSGQSES
jgi:L-threonylcarbamoyladenylate synthase